ncbi:MAG TPA: thiopurine S-methyltransferase [Burkholderiales bacterium]
MDRDFWLKIWETNRIEFHQQEINSWLQKFWPTLGLPGGAEVFVPLCGKSRDMLWLRDQGHRVLGVELSELAVRAFFAESGLTPHVREERPFVRWEADGIALWCGDYFALVPEDLARTAAVYDRAALIALPPPMRRRYVAKLEEILRPGTVVLLLSITYPDGQMDGPPFSVPESEVRELYAPGFALELLASEDAFRPDSALARRGLRELSAQAYRLRRK